MEDFNTKYENLLWLDSIGCDYENWSIDDVMVYISNITVKHINSIKNNDMIIPVSSEILRAIDILKELFYSRTLFKEEKEFVFDKAISKNSLSKNTILSMLDIQYANLKHCVGKNALTKYYKLIGKEIQEAFNIFHILEYISSGENDTVIANTIITKENITNKNIKLLNYICKVILENETAHRQLVLVTKTIDDISYIRFLMILYLIEKLNKNNKKNTQLEKLEQFCIQGITNVFIDDKPNHTSFRFYHLFDMIKDIANGNDVYFEILKELMSTAFKTLYNQKEYFDLEKAQKLMEEHLTIDYIKFYIELLEIVIKDNVGDNNVITNKDKHLKIILDNLNKLLKQEQNQEKEYINKIEKELIIYLIDKLYK